MPPFEEILESEKKRIHFICEFPVFKVPSKNKNEKEKESYWNAFNLVPDIKRYNEVLAMEYAHKLVCEFVANGNRSEWEKLYYKTRSSDVWDYLAIRKAVIY